jgi:hypothetical protein
MGLLEDPNCFLRTYHPSDHLILFVQTKFSALLAPDDGSSTLKSSPSLTSLSNFYESSVDDVEGGNGYLNFDFQSTAYARNDAIGVSGKGTYFSPEIKTGSYMVADQPSTNNNNSTYAQTDQPFIPQNASQYILTPLGEAPIVDPKLLAGGTEEPNPPSTIEAPSVKVAKTPFGDILNNDRDWVSC